MKPQVAPHLNPFVTPSHAYLPNTLSYHPPSPPQILYLLSPFHFSPLRSSYFSSPLRFLHPSDYPAYFLQFRQSPHPCSFLSLPIDFSTNCLVGDLALPFHHFTIQCTSPRSSTKVPRQAYIQARTDIYLPKFELE